MLHFHVSYGRLTQAPSTVPESFLDKVFAEYIFPWMEINFMSKNKVWFCLNREPWAPIKNGPGHVDSNSIKTLWLCALPSTLCPNSEHWDTKEVIDFIEIERIVGLNKLRY